MKQKKARDVRPEFRVILYQAVYEGLRSICPSAPEAVLLYLERDGSIGPDRTIEDPEAFHKGLSKIFGFGANLIERRILGILYERLQIDGEIQDRFCFLHEVKTVRKKLSSVKVEAFSFETVNV